MTHRPPDVEDTPADETVCPRCAVGCHLARGDDTERASGRTGPANPNGRLCPKGIGAFQVVDDEERLARPTVRRDGEPEPVTWETAIETVVDRLGAVLDAHGSDSLAFLGAPHCTNEENYLLGKLARTLGTNNVDNRARLCHVATARALDDRIGWPATTNSLDDVGAADVVLVVGANPAARQPVAFDAFLRPAVNEGSTLVHVDPVGNRTTRLADHHLAPRPGTDAVVLDLLSAGVLAADGADGAFVDERTTGFEPFAAELAALDREQAVEEAGVDPEALDAVVETIAAADRVAAMTGTGIDGDPTAAAPDALVNLLLLTGGFGRRGTGLHLLRGLVNEQGATDAGCVPDRLPGHQPVTDPDARARIAAEWGVEPPAEPGATAHELLSGFGDPIRGAVVVGENPAVSKREHEWLRRRFEALDVLVVLDVAESETTPHADVVLPAAAGVEKAGTVTNLDRRVQRLRPAAAPPGQARPDFDVLCDLGRRLADGDVRFDYAGPAEVFDELTQVAPTHAGVTDDDVDAGGRRWPFDRPPVLYRESFGTADGQARFVAPEPLAEATDRDDLRLVTGGRASDVDADTVDPRLRLHPADAADRAVEAGETVVVTNGEADVEATADPTTSARKGAVYLHAAVADPLVRSGDATVEVEPLARTARDDE
jgi:formate dehydrogenase major subunit